MDNATNKRLASLDLLRGADIFFLTVFCPILYEVNRVWPMSDRFMCQFGHPDWVGFSVLDMVMPLFIFMCGAALPLALPRRLEPDGHAGRRYWGHVFARVALLWGLGMFAQGEIQSFDLHRISFFNNTLQAIACGYLIGAAVMRLKSRLGQVALTLAMAFGYSLFLRLGGDMSPTGNAAVLAEVKFLTLFYPDATWYPVSQIVDWHYTWWPTIPMFGFMALAGAFSTEILRSALSPKRRAGALAAVGCGLLALGGVFSLFEPVVKHIYTSSFTFLATGGCVLLFALFYVLFDILEIRRGTAIFALFGRRSLMAYLLIETSLRSVLRSAAAIVFCGTSGKVGDGISRFFSPEASELVIMVLISILLCALLVFWEKVKASRVSSK